MINLDDKNFSDEARLYFRDMGISGENDFREMDLFAGRVNAINAILSDNREKLKQALAESGLSTAHEFEVLQFTSIPYNRFAQKESSLKAKKTTDFLEIAQKNKAKKCIEYLEPYDPEKKKRRFFKRR